MSAYASSIPLSPLFFEDCESMYSLKLSSTVISNASCFLHLSIRTLSCSLHIFFRASSSSGLVSHTSPRAFTKGAPMTPASFSRPFLPINTKYFPFASNEPTVSPARALLTLTSWPFCMMYLSESLHSPFVTRSLSLVSIDT